MPLAGAMLWFGMSIGAAADRPKFRNSAPAPIRDQTSNGSVPTGMGGVTVIPRGGYQTDPVGLPYSTLFRNTRFPSRGSLTIPPVEPSLHTESIEARAVINLPTITSGLPFLQKGFDPQDADLKVGPFFFKLRAIQGAVLHSDNINLSPDNERESGTIAITSATVNIIAQLTENLRLATSCTLVYLPIEGEAGIAGFSNLSDLYSFGLFNGPTTRAQVAWQTQIGGWNVVFSDEFSVGLGYYSNSVRTDYQLFEGGGFDGVSQAGRYSFRAPGGNQRSKDDNRRDQNEFDTDFVVFSNTVMAATDRLLPGSIRLRARVYHEDLWYNQGNRGLPRLREGGLLSLSSERVNTRFKPFVSYEAFRTDRDSGFQNIFRVGVSGPITNQLELHAEGGYYSGGERESGYLWRFALNHTVGPYTRQSLFYFRDFSDFHEEITEGIGYNLRQTLGPRLYADAYIYKLRIEEQGGEEAGQFQSTRDELRTGLRLTYTAGPKTIIRMSANFSDFQPEDSQTWTGRIDVGYNFTDTLLARFLYQYQQRSSSSFASNNYSENLFFLSFTKAFE